MSKKQTVVPERIDWLLVGCAGLAITWATFLLNDVPELRMGSPDGRWPPSLIARLLTVPVPMTGTSDLRWYAIPFCLSLGLIVILVRGTWSRSEGSPALLESTGGMKLRDWWFLLLAFSVLAAGCLSATMNDTWSISQGWLFWFATGVGWSMLVAATIRASSLLRLLLVALVVGAIASMLTIWHRIALGQTFMDMPVGPTTVTGSLGAFWASASGAVLACFILIPGARWAIGRRMMVLSMLLFLSGFGLLIVAARRGGWIGLVLALVFVMAVVLSSRIKIGRRQIAATIVGSIVLMLGGVFVQQQIISPRVNLARSFGLRVEYWKNIARQMKGDFLFGNGPDMFAYKMTNAMALKRAEEPRLTHGSVDFDAHNEWLQAAFELGAPGALAYVALPIIAVILAARRLQRQPEDRFSILALALAAGLVSILVTESGSINLRHPIMPVWYWTTIGALIALVQPGVLDSVSQQVVTRRVPVIIRGLCPLAAVAILGVVFMDLRRGLAHEAGRLELSKNRNSAEVNLATSLKRLGARNWIWTRFDLGTLYSSELRARRQATTTQSAENVQSQNAKDAVAIWGEVAGQCAAYRDSGYRLAEAQFLSGDRNGALKTLTHFLAEVNPYDRDANLLRLHMGGLTSLEGLLAIRRALRSSPLDSVIVSYAFRELAAPEVQSGWAELVALAMRDSATPVNMPWQDPLSPETLRIQALRLATQSKLPEAAQASVLVTGLYDALAASGSPARRSGIVEADAWYLAARMSFDNQPARFKVAFDMICNAEEAAVLQVVAVPGTSLGQLDLDPVCLRNRTPELRQLLRFSALMHLAVGADLKEVARRANWSLPGSRHTQAQVDTEVSVMAAELVDAFSRLPEEQRPPNLRRLFELAQRVQPKKAGS